MQYLHPGGVATARPELVLASNMSAETYQGGTGPIPEFLSALHMYMHRCTLQVLLRAGAYLDLASNDGAQLLAATPTQLQLAVLFCLSPR
jgi:hypothetical protein